MFIRGKELFADLKVFLLIRLGFLILCVLSWRRDALRLLEHIDKEKFPPGSSLLMWLQDLITCCYCSGQAFDSSLQTSRLGCASGCCVACHPI